MPALALISERAGRPFESVDDLKRRTPLHKDELRVLAEAGALNALTGHRREALWQVERELLPEDDLFAPSETTGTPALSPLSPMTLQERVRSDFRTTATTTGTHPMALLRPRLQGVWSARDLKQAPHGLCVQIAGAVICRQRPGTARGVLFMSLEDETGIANAIVSPELFEQKRLTIIEEPFIVIEGTVQQHECVIHLRASRLEPLLDAPLETVTSHDFH